MNEKKSKTLLFILGISLGIVVGAGFMHWASPVAPGYKEVSENMIEQIVNKVYGLLSTRKSSQDSLVTEVSETDKISKKESIKQQETKEEAASLPDSSQNFTKETSLLADTLVQDSTQGTAILSVSMNDEIVVKKDELLANKNVELVNLDYLATKQGQRYDSTLQVISGIKDNTKLVEARYMYPVELWKSPINYKGYKLSHTKLILFGINTDAPLKLYYFNETVYLKYADQFYKLDYYSDYKPFERIANQVVISQLTKQ
jgi:xanthosine utilization system XapX-like protein